MDPTAAPATEAPASTAPATEAPAAPSLSSSESVPMLGRLDALFGQAPEPAAADPAPAETPDPSDPAPAAAAAADPAAGEDDPTPTGLTDKGKVAWGTLRKQLKEAKAAHTAAQKELEELRATAKPAELSTLEQELASAKERLSKYEGELSVSRLEATQEYQDAVVAPVNALRNMVSTLGSTYELDSDKLFDAVVENDPKIRVKKLAALAEPMLEPDRLRLYKAAEDFDHVFAVKTQMETNASETLKKIEADRTAASRAAEVARLAQRKVAEDQTWKLLEDRTPILKDATIAAEVRRIAATADLQGTDPTLVAYSAFAGAALPKVVAAHREALTEIENLKGQIAALTGASPGGNHGDGGGSPLTAAPAAKPGSFLDAIESRFSGKAA